MRRRFEPAVAVPLLEHVLQRGHAGREQRDADAVDRRAIRDELRLVDELPREVSRPPMPTGTLTRKIQCQLAQRR